MSNKQIDPKFEELRRICDPDGVIAVVSLNRDNGRVTFAFSKEFERGGKTERTPYLSHRHIEGVRRILDDLEQSLPAEEDRARAALRRRSA